MVGLQNLFEVRIVGLDQRPLLQLAEVEPHPEGNHDDGHGHVFQDAEAEMQMPPGVREIRFNQPEHIPAAGEDHDLADQDNAVFVPFQVAREEQREGNEPVEHEVQRSDHAPAPANAVEIPGNLFREVARPDDKELRKSDVNVEHHEGKSQFAQVVLFGFAEHSMHGLRLGKPDHRDDGERENTIALPDQKHEPIHRRIPRGVEGHDPVDGADGHSDGVDQHAEAAEIFQAHLPETHVGMRIGVTLQSPLVEQVHEDEPDGKADCGLYPDTAHTEHGALVGNGVRLLVGDQVLVEGLHGIAVLRPQIQLLHEDADRQEQYDNQGQATG